MFRQIVIAQGLDYKTIGIPSIYKDDQNDYYVRTSHELLPNKYDNTKHALIKNDKGACKIRQ